MIVIGGTGTLGSAFVNRVLQNQEEFLDSIKIISRDDTKQMRLWEELGRPGPEDVNFFIRDANEIEDSHFLDGQEEVVNFAAMKHVPSCMANPIEAVRNNVMQIDRTMKAFNTDNYTLVSTDKAVRPINVYGMTKAIAERLVLQHGGKVIRLGNILDSRGSVLPLARRQAKQGKVKLTDERMKRYFIEKEEAAKYIHKTVENGRKGKVHIPKDMEEKRIKPMLEKIAEEHDAELEVVGKRPGEKLSEDLTWDDEDPVFL